MLSRVGSYAPTKLAIKLDGVVFTSARALERYPGTDSVPLLILPAAEPSGSCSWRNACSGEHFMACARVL
jgi:hypothetical protein